MAKSLPNHFIVNFISARLTRSLLPFISKFNSKKMKEVSNTNGSPSQAVVISRLSFLCPTRVFWMNWDYIPIVLLGCCCFCFGSDLTWIETIQNYLLEYSVSPIDRNLFNLIWNKEYVERSLVDIWKDIRWTSYLHISTFISRNNTKSEHASNNIAAQWFKQLQKEEKLTLFRFPISYQSMDTLIKMKTS